MILRPLCWPRYQDNVSAASSDLLHVCLMCHRVTMLSCQWSVGEWKSECLKHVASQIFSPCFIIAGCGWVSHCPVGGGVIGAGLVTSATLETSWPWSAISQLCSRPAATTSLLWRWSRISQGERFIVSSRSGPRLIFDNSSVWGVRKA